VSKRTIKFRVQVASLKTLYALVQIRAAWRAALTRPDKTPVGSRHAADPKE